MDSLPLNKLDYCLLICGMVLLCCLGRRKWLLIGGITSMLFGVGWVLTPRSLLLAEFKKDYVHESVLRLARIFGSYRVVNGVMLLQSFYRNDDRFLHIASLMSQFVGMLPSFASTINLHFEVPAAATEARGKCMIPFFLWAWGSGYHLLTTICEARDQAITVEAKRDAINNHLLLEAVLSVASASAWLLFSATMTKNTISMLSHEPTAFDLHLCRSIGFFLIGQSTMMVVSTLFKRQQDKKLPLMGRTLINIYLSTLLVYYASAAGVNALTNKIVAFQILFLLFSTINACGCFIKSDQASKKQE